MSKPRKFFYRQGKFFILYGDYRYRGFTVSLGPDRWVFLSFFLLVFLFGVSVICTDVLKDYTRLNQLFTWCFWIGIICYLYTAICNPGVIIPTEDNTIESKDDLESKGYTYCAVCQLYRPPTARHCATCGVCIDNIDHHCVVMGQCVTKRNLITFYLFIGCCVFSFYIFQFIMLMKFKTPLVLFSRIKKFFSY